MTQAPSIFSATRSLPRSSRSMVAATACLTAGSALPGDIAARCSQAFSMRVCSSSMRLPSKVGDKIAYALRGLGALGRRSDQRNTHAVGAGIDAARFAGEIAARQHRYRLLLKQTPGEFGIARWRRYPQIKRGVRHIDVECWLQYLDYIVEFFSIQAPVLDDVCLVLPRRNARHVNRRTHRAALVGAVEQKFFQNLRIAGDEAGTHAWHIGALGQAREHDQSRESRPAAGLRSLQC